MKYSLKVNHALYSSAVHNFHNIPRNTKKDVNFKINLVFLSCMTRKDDLQPILYFFVIWDVHIVGSLTFTFTFEMESTLAA